MGDGPRVVAIGGGHGLAATLRAITHYAGSVTAVVSVADDGGSSGRLRRELGLPPPGDLRKCLVALAAPDSPWAAALEHRFSGGHLDGHALGNLVIAGLTEVFDDFVAALDEVARLLDARGRVLPATTEPVVLKAVIDGRPVEGQVNVASAGGRIRSIGLVPADPPAHPDVLAALAAADQIVLAPGSLFTSLIPVLCIPSIRDALVNASGRVVQVCNLRAQVPETAHLAGHEHLAAVRERGVRVHDFVYDPCGRLAVDPDAVRALDAHPVPAPVGDSAAVTHDATALAAALRDLVAPN